MKNIVILTLLFINLFYNKTYSQEISKDNYYGQWSDNASWLGGWTDNTPLLLGLPETNANITIQGYIQIGSSGGTGTVLSFSTSKNAFQFTVNDTLVVYGDVNFGNDAMDLVMGPGAVFIIFGNLNMKNKIEMSSDGTLIVTGTFDKTGTLGNFTGTGDVYAGAFTGDAEATIDVGGDSSFLIDQLSDDGFSALETFVTGGGESPLPIELTYFQAYTNKNHVTINWQTATELNNDYFTIERSADGVNYKTIATVRGSGTSMSAINYSFTDNNPLTGVSYYRLKQTDYDGAFEIFSPVSVSYLIENEIKIGSNLAANELTISMNGEMGSGMAKIYNVIGVLVKTFEIESNYTTVILSDIPKGTYILVVSANKTQITKKILVQ
jgi:hypothetical protein